MNTNDLTLILKVLEYASIYPHILPGYLLYTFKFGEIVEHTFTKQRRNALQISDPEFDQLMQIRVYPSKVEVFEVDEQNNDYLTLIKICLDFKSFSEIFLSREPSEDDFNYWRSQNKQ